MNAIDYTSQSYSAELLPAGKSIGAELVSSRQVQEVQAAMVVAKKFPRDEIQAYNRIMQACCRKKLAQSAVYEYPRGGEKISGPSIRLAEELARDWGNLDFGIIELEQRAGESTMMAYCWDLETNTRRSIIFQAKHERKARKQITKLDDPRDIYELTANMGARRMRACILGVIPSDVVESAVERCEKTMVEGESTPLIDRLRILLAAFEKYGVTKEMMEKYIGCNMEAFSERDGSKLVKIHNSLKDGMAKREDYFELNPGNPVSATEADFLKAQQQKQEANPDEANNPNPGTEGGTPGSSKSK